MRRRRAARRPWSGFMVGILWGPFRLRGRRTLAGNTCHQLANQGAQGAHTFVGAHLAKSVVTWQDLTNQGAQGAQGAHRFTWLGVERLRPDITWHAILAYSL